MLSEIDRQILQANVLGDKEKLKELMEERERRRLEDVENEV